MDFLLRPAQISDLEQILAIYNAEILDGTANWNNMTKSSADFQTWFSSLMAQQFPLFVAEHRASKKLRVTLIIPLSVKFMVLNRPLNIRFLFIQTLAAKV